MAKSIKRVTYFCGEAVINLRYSGYPLTDRKTKKKKGKNGRRVGGKPS